jgi:hypothetical protein
VPDKRENKRSRETNKTNLEIRRNKCEKKWKFGVGLAAWLWKVQLNNNPTEYDCAPASGQGWARSGEKGSRHGGSFDP